MNRINIVNILTRRAVQARYFSPIPSGGKEFSFLRTTVREQFGVHPASCAVGMGLHSPWGRVGCESYLSLLSGAEKWCRSFECNALKVYVNVFLLNWPSSDKQLEVDVVRKRIQNCCIEKLLMCVDISFAVGVAKLVAGFERITAVLPRIQVLRDVAFLPSPSRFPKLQGHYVRLKRQGRQSRRLSVTALKTTVNPL